VEAIAGEYSDKVKFVKVNVDQNSDLASKYNVFGKPTLAIFNKGNVISQQIGVPVNAKESLKNLIEKALKKA
jgi:thioredoxin 1